MKSIDLRGICCPINFVKAKLALEHAGEGEVLEVLLDYGEPVRNLPRSLKAEGHRLLGMEEREGCYVLKVEKGTE